MEETFIYNYIDKSLLSLIQQYGICSPRKLYEIDRKIFHSNVYELYKDRAAHFLNKEISLINDEDILFFLDNSKRINRSGSDSIFFFILPVTYMRDYSRFKNSFELKININNLQNYSPFIFYNETIYQTNWNNIFDLNNIEKVKKIMMEMKYEECLYLKNIPQIIIKTDIINFSLIDGITKNWNRYDCKKIIVNDKMQNNYIYYRTEKIGDLNERFTPDLTPNQMLQMGVFEGKYMNDCFKEFDGTDLFKNAKLSDIPDESINYYKVKSRLGLKYWKDNGWIYDEDPRGWFQWYCRYYYGRRCPDDERQINRWRSFKARVSSQLLNNCSGNQECRPVQRQSLIQWAIDARKM